LLGDIHSLVSDGSQFIIATHSPILMAYPDAEILRFSDMGRERTEYRQTEHYQITKKFLDNPQRMLDIIFGSRPE
ncbi:MAG: ABC transporter ATP-binding protein, partial [Oscillospiraceae bacterium]|nr:ABC transporter ATP-binding protein [Oscillospiraceae bacterium]